eukprot:GHVT01105272.1.p2 GENE.GHVT01105272.1~~GHVT01105272.1.p2  ORF type:complete len:146 (+),score=6.84 GHVT01105272.1:1279-1716(+)
MKKLQATLIELLELLKLENIVNQELFTTPEVPCCGDKPRYTSSRQFYSYFQRPMSREGALKPNFDVNGEQDGCASHISSSHFVDSFHSPLASTEINKINMWNQRSHSSCLDEESLEQPLPSAFQDPLTDDYEIMWNEIRNLTGHA